MVQMIDAIASLARSVEQHRAPLDNPEGPG
jgi:hypothetical protein